MNDQLTEEDKRFYVNLYYMLFYVWDKANIKLLEKINIDLDEINDPLPLNLFSIILVEMLDRMIKKGFDRNYELYSTSLTKPRGKINFVESIKFIGLRQLNLQCEYDELTYNTLQNQIIKATLKILMNNKTIKAKNKVRLKKIYRYFHKIDLIDLNKHIFKKTIIHKNNRNYKFILKICELIYNNYIIQKNNSNEEFIDISKDGAMDKIFEKFVRKFYEYNYGSEYSPKKFKVLGKNIEWKWKENVIEGSKDLIPHMETDIYLESKTNIIIIDTKYYKEILNKNYDKNKFKTPNLYQISAYLENTINNNEKKLTGILLYAERGNEINFCAKLEEKGKEKYIICVKTVDLNKDWKEIEERLKDIVEKV